MAMLRKVKEKLKKAVQRNKKVFVEKVAKVIPKGIKRKKVSSGPKKEIMGTRETVIEQAKFSNPEPARGYRIMPHDLPYQYGKDRMVLQVRDPWWIHAYWELTHQTLERFKNELKDEFYKAKRVLRVYDVSQINFNGKNAHSFFDIYIDDHATSWYIDTKGPGRSWCVDLGLILSDGSFITILRSNVVSTPLEGPSWITDEEWMIPEEMFARLYGLGFGLGKSSPVGKDWARQVREAFVSSPGVSSVTSPSKKPEVKRKFWMVVDCELIVYGATEPDAKVTVQDKEIKLRPDGTFTLRFALPDAKQVIPVKAASSDGIEERTITPIVSRETKTSALIKNNI